MSADTVDTMPLDGMPEPPQPGEPETPQPPADNGDAPYGYKADGTPKRAPGRPSTKRAAGSSTPAPPRKPRPSERAKSAAAKREPYRVAVAGFVDISVGVCAAVGKTTNDPAFLADAVYLDQQKPLIAEQVSIMAEQYPAVAALLDRAAEASPFVMLAYLGTTIAAQIAVNHRRLPAGMLGTVTPESLLGARTAPAAAASAAA